jgi:type II secretory ATPase GspE/PulE/Tfp pilus assembly ATPase PilB-like protein
MAAADADHAELQKRADLLAEVVTEIHSADSVSDIILNQTPRLIELFDADRVTIYSIDTHGNQLYSLFKRGGDVNEIRVPMNHSSIAGHCAVSKQGVNILNAYDHEELRRYHPDLRFDSRWDQRTGFVTRQVLVTPVMHGDYLLGVFQVVNRRSGGAFDKSDIDAARRVARTLGVAFFNQRRIGRQAKPNRFGLLLDSGLISEQRLDEAVSYARINGQPIARVLIDKCGIDKEQLLKSLAQYYNTDYFIYDGTQMLAEEYRERFSYEQLKKLGVVPIKRVNRMVQVALDDPSDLEKLDLVRHMNLGPTMQYLVALSDDISKLLAVSYGVSDEEDDDSATAEVLSDISVDSQVVAAEADEAEADETDSEIVRAASMIIKEAVEYGASDIHVEPYGDRRPTRIRYRVDGVCHTHKEIEPSYRKALVSRLKIMSKLDIAEKRKPQDGKIRIRFGDRTVELRVATIPTTGGEEDVVMRILAASKPLELKQLGLNQRNLRVLAQMAQKPYGIVLCVGPTGSGKTTTLHSVLGYINTDERKIWTAEDPVEITQPGLRQVEVKPKIGFTFAAAMRSFLRADPDVIMVGEMRDHETAAIGIEASLTGHLVLSTLHTNSAAETITRLLEMEIDAFNFADALIGILAQRLVRTLCKECKEAYTPSQQDLATLCQLYGAQQLSQLGIEDQQQLRLYHPKGCNACGGTGYKGRMGLHELLDATDAVKHLILKGAKVDQIRHQAQRDGMTTLMQDGIWKVLRGHTDLTQVRAVCLR